MSLAGYLTDTINKVNPYLGILLSLILIILGLSLQIRRAHDIGWGKKMIVLIILFTLLVFVFAFVVFLAALLKNVILLALIAILNVLVGLVLAIISILLLFKLGQNMPNRHGGVTLPRISIRDILAI